MAVPEKLRRILLWGSLALTLAAAAWQGGEEVGVEVVEATDRPVASTHRTSLQMPVQTLMLDKLQRRQHGHEVGALFPAHSWDAPPPVARTMAPEPPAAPPLPFTCFGKLVANGQTQVFLNMQERNFAVRKGDVIDGIYRVDAIGPTALTLIYLPLNIKQIMPIGEPN